MTAFFKLYEIGDWQSILSYVLFILINCTGFEANNLSSYYDVMYYAIA